MNIPERTKIAREMFDECLKVAESKGKDYSSNQDSLSNFKRNGDKLGLTKYQVWAVYAAKHLDAVFNSIKYNPDYPQVESEPMHERIKDVIVYMTLLEALMVEDNQQKNDRH